VYRSKDNGKAWSEPITVFDDPKYDPNEGCLVEMPGGTLVICERTNKPTKGAIKMISDDGGATWKGPFAAEHRWVGGRVFAHRLSTGEVLVVHRIGEGNFGFFVETPATAIARAPYDAATYKPTAMNWGFINVEHSSHPDGQVCIRKYYNVSRYKSIPACYMQVMAHDIPYYYRQGARQFHYMHVTTGHWGAKSLTNYQMARQLWDVNSDCQPLWADYFARRYGPAAPTMRRFYESLENMLCNVEALKGWSSRFLPALSRGSKRFFPDSHLQYRREPGLKCDGPTLVEMVGHGRNASPGGLLAEQ
jgi:hypothetical protein